MNSKMKKRMSILLLTTYLGTIPVEGMALPVEKNLEITEYDMQLLHFSVADYLLSYQNEEKKQLLTLDSRIQQIKVLNQNQTNKIGSAIDFEKLETFMQTNAFFYCLEYAEMYGIDPWLLLALAYQESNLCHESNLPGGSHYNGHGVGLTQQESPNEEKFVTAYNYQTKSYDTIGVNMENACNLKTNIQICTMKLQCYLLDRNNNVFLALQTYNYGTPMVNRALKLYANETGKTIEQITNDKSDTGWLKYIEDIHNFPQRYGLAYKNYGDDKYIEHVLRYYLGNYIYLRSLEQEEIFDFTILESKPIYLYEKERLESKVMNQKVKNNYFNNR